MNKTVLISFIILCLLSTAFLMGFKISVKASPDVIYVPTDYLTTREAINAGNPEGFVPIGINETIANLTCPLGTALNFTYTLNSTIHVDIQVDPCGLSDYDIYVKWDGSQPSLEDYDDRTNLGTDSPRRCSKRGLPLGTYYFMVYHEYSIPDADTLPTTFDVTLTGFYAVHNINTSLSYPTIQAAIDANETLDGHTILVDEGIYYEHVVVNKSLTLIEASRENTIIDGNHTGIIVSITAPFVKLKNFTIRNSGRYAGEENAGVYIDDVVNCKVINNTITQNDLGIYLVGSSDNEISGNKVTLNNEGVRIHPKTSDVGSVISQSNNNRIFSNNITNNQYNGVWLMLADNNTLSGNNVTNTENGILVEWSSNNTLTNNNMSGNFHNFGVYGRYLSHFINNIDTSNLVNNNPVYYLTNQKDLTVDPSTFPNIGYLGVINSTNVTVQNLILTSNRQGLLIAFTENSTIKNNRFVGNHYGVLLEDSGNNIISGNEIMHNDLGILLEDSLPNNTISGNQILNNGIGCVLGFSSGNAISRNNITNNDYGFQLLSSHANTLSENTIRSNDKGLYIASSSNNKIYHNNFINNTRWHIWTEDSIITWDDGYPSGGNYWSDYTGVDLRRGPYQNDTGSDGIGDTLHIFDYFPLMGPIYFFDVGIWDEVSCKVHVVSNSTVSSFLLNRTQKIISFNVTGLHYTMGFCRVTIPNIIIQEMWNCNYTVLVNGEPAEFRNWTNNRSTYVYFTYQHPEHEVTIIPEFPRALVLSLLMISTLVAVVSSKKKRSYINKQLQ